MAKWYDPFLTKDERRLQVGQKGIRARNRAKQMGVNTGEAKQVGTGGQTTSRAGRASMIRQNAQQKQNGYSDSRNRIESAFKKKGK